MSEYRRAVLELLGEEPDTIEIDGRWTCRWCGRVYSGMAGDNQVLELCPDDDCPGHKARKILEQEDNRRIEEAARLAAQSFWDTIVDLFPEITTGDLGPDSVLAFQGACESVVRAWVNANS